MGQAVLGWVILGHLDMVHPAQKTHFPQKSHLTCTRDSTAVLGHRDRTLGQDMLGHTVLGHGILGHEILGHATP